MFTRCFTALLLCCYFGHLQASELIAPNAQLQQLSDAFSFTEGPASDADGNVYFTDQPNNRIYLWQPESGITLFREPAGRANGLYVDNAGNLLMCTDEQNRLSRLSPQGEVEILLSDLDGKRFNGPNDVWESKDGHIYFTDPYYQRDYWQHSTPEMTHQSVYMLTTDGQLKVMDNQLRKPNGIIGHDNVLYVADIEADKTYAYTIASDGTLTNKREFVSMGSDGMTLDEQGNLYLTGKGVTVFNPAGEQIAHIEIDQPWTANVTFGGKHFKTLFITAMDSVYTLEMQVRGARRGSKP